MTDNWTFFKIKAHNSKHKYRNDKRNDNTVGLDRTPVSPKATKICQEEILILLDFHDPKIPFV